MKTLYSLARQHADLVAALAVVTVYCGLLLIWVSLEDAALRAERAERQYERLLVTVMAAVMGASTHDERGDGGASSRLAADRPADHSGGGQGHVPAGTDGHHDGDGRKRQPAAAHDGAAARMIVE